MADERIPILLDLPAKHRSISVAPMIGPVQNDKYLKTGFIEGTGIGGERHGNGHPRPLYDEWV